MNLYYTSKSGSNMWRCICRKGCLSKRLEYCWVRACLPTPLVLFLFLLSAATIQAQVGATCGGTANLKCPDGQACRFPVGQCDAADLPGSCVAVSSTCPEGGPKVCGCDGITYGN